MKTLLILSASVGGGHDSVARALQEACAARHASPLQASWHDSLARSALARTCYVAGYRFLTDRAPRLLATLYARTYDDVDGVGRRLTSGLGRVLLRNVAKLVAALRPDAVVCTHFAPVAAVPPRIPTYVVIPDHDCHALWVDRRARAYFVADERVRDLLVARGVAPGAVAVTGVPLRASFAVRHDRATVRAALGLGDGPVVLVMGSVFGAPATREAVALLRRRADLQLVIVSGANERLRGALAPFAGDRVRVLGQRDDVSALMDAADLLVTKAGGVTVSEALAKGLPMVLFRPIPGQEERNAEFAVDSGAALRADTAAELARAVELLLGSSERRHTMRMAALRVARPDAAAEVLRLLFEVFGASDWARTLVVPTAG